MFFFLISKKHKAVRDAYLKAYSITTNEITREQMCKLFTDVNGWHTWNSGVENALLNGLFEQCSHILLNPKDDSKIKIILSEIIEKRLFITASFSGKTLLRAFI